MRFRQARALNSLRHHLRRLDRRNRRRHKRRRRPRPWDGLHRAQPDGLRRSRGLRLDLRRRQLEGLGRQSEVLARRGRRHRRRIDARPNPSGNSYIVYRELEAKDFTLKFEIKVEGTGGSGIQYRSRTGLPWLANIPADRDRVNVGPVNLNWMMTGPQADFWPSRVYTGQFYSENTPMRILAWRGQVVEGFGDEEQTADGHDRRSRGARQRRQQNDWNQYVVIARGGTFLHIVNGQLMAVMIDDDPESSNNQPGLFGIEIEATTKVSVRNMWVKKLS